MPHTSEIDEVTPDQLDQVVQDFHDAGASVVNTTKQADGNFTVIATFGDAVAAPVAPAPAAVLGVPGLLATASPQQTLSRAQSSMGRNTVYEMLPSDNDPMSPFPHRCDCSGFVDWSIGSWRQLPPRSDHWLYTDSIWDGGGEVGEGLFVDLKGSPAIPGDFYVYPSPDAQHKGHIAIITQVDSNGKPVQIIHCSLSNYNNTNDAVRVTGPQVFLANDRSRIVRPNYDAIRIVAGAVASRRDAVPAGVVEGARSDGKTLPGNKLWPWSAEIEGNDIVVRNVKVTGFGGGNDPGDRSGDTESGVRNDGGNPHLFGCALPVKKDEDSTKDSPLAFVPHIPWLTKVRFWQGDDETSAIETLLIDNGPDVRDYPDHWGDLTVAAAQHFAPNIPIELMARKFEMTLSYRVIGGAQFVQ